MTPPTSSLPCSKARTHPPDCGASPAGHSWAHLVGMWPQPADKTRPCQRRWREDQVPLRHAARRDVGKCILRVPYQRQTRIRKRLTMKKRQARKILNQVLQQGRPVSLPDGRRASKRTIRRARGSNSDPLADSAPQELKHMAGLARRFDSARRRQKQSSDRSFKRAARSRARRAPVGVAAN